MAKIDPRELMAKHEAMLQELSNKGVCRCSVCKDRVLNACRASYDIMMCCGCPQTNVENPFCVEGGSKVAKVDIIAVMQESVPQISAASIIAMAAPDINCGSPDPLPHGLHAASGSAFWNLPFQGLLQQQYEARMNSSAGSSAGSSANNSMGESGLMFTREVIEASAFEWPELTGKCLTIAVGESEGKIIVIGHEVGTEHNYVLHCGELGGSGYGS